MSEVFLFIIGARVYLELSDVLELLDSGPSRSLPLACAYVCCCCFFSMGYVESSIFRNRNLEFNTPNIFYGLPRKDKYAIKLNQEI
jgi:hypothetical protein